MHRPRTPRTPRPHRPRAATAGVAAVMAAVAAMGLFGTNATSAAATKPHPAAAAPTAPAAQRVQGGPELGRGGVIVNYPSQAWPRVPDAQGDAFVVADADTGQVLAAKNPHAWYGPASTIKILTAISLIPVLNPNATTAASASAASQEPDDVGLVVGHQYPIADLFRALLLISANDSAVALAEATGSFNHAIALMNAEAHRLQAYDTVAKTPNGLDAPGQHVSAYDQALIARQALRSQAFMTYDTTRTAMFVVKDHHQVQLFNQDTLLGNYPGFLGGKTGWTTPAKATYTGMARRNGHTLIVTILHAVPLTWRTTAPALLDWGFAVDGKIRPVGHLVNPLPPPAPRAPKRPVQRPAARMAPATAAHSISAVPVVAAVIGGLAAIGFGVMVWRLAASRR